MPFLTKLFNTTIFLACLLTGVQSAVAAASIDAVYFAQTHVQKTSNPHFVLVGNREALVKVHVIDPAAAAAPPVNVVLSFNGSPQTLTVPLTGPAILPTNVPDGPGVVAHSYDNSFTAIIPAEWMKPNLIVTVNAGTTDQETISNLNIGAPSRVIMTMTDVHFFSLRPGDYPTGWEAELEAKWPVSSLDVRRAEDVVFHELVIPPREGVPAARITSRDDYFSQTGIGFDGENSAATAWNVALRRAGGRAQAGYTLQYLSKYNVSNEGVAGGFSGVGTGDAGSAGVFSHELGHALSLPHWGDNGSYPYKGAMHGIQAPDIYNETHAGPTWAFDLPTRAFIPATTQPGNAGGKPVGTYKADPMQGGGVGFQEPPFIFNHFSDYSVNQMRNYLQNTVVVWNASANSYAKWSNVTDSYSNLVSNDDVKYPMERDQSVISIIASVSGASPEVCMVYPPIGPYTAGIIRTFDPSVPADRTAAAATFSPAGGSDVCFRVTQSGIVSTYMLAASYNTAADPLAASSLVTEGINLRAADGPVTKVELLLTPDAQIDGLPASPAVLYTWTPPSAPTPNPAAFATTPTTTGPFSITMTANTATGDSDSNGSVEYRFTETSGNLGGTTSEWQSSPTYTDVDLQPETQYRYTVTVRSGISKATGNPSSEASATTNTSTATSTRLTTGGTDSWNTGSWSNAIPVGPIDAAIAPGLLANANTAVTPWSGTLTLESGSSLRISLEGLEALRGATALTLENATIFDDFKSHEVFPPITLVGGGGLRYGRGSSPFNGTSRAFNGPISGDGGFSTSGQRFMTYSFNATNPYTGGFVATAQSKYVVEFNAVGAAGKGDVTIVPRSLAEPLSAVIRLGANNVFDPQATLTLDGEGWFGQANGQYGRSVTRIDMRTFDATVAKLIIDGQEVGGAPYPNTYTGTSGTWIRGTGTLTVTGTYGYLQWINDHPGLAALSAPADDPDEDGQSNLLEFAFGMNPEASDATPLNYTAGDAVTTPGTTYLENFSTNGGEDFHAVFARRKDHLTAGLAYTVQFSADLITWTDSLEMPVVLTGAANPAAVEAVSVSFPLIVPVNGGFEAPNYYRVTVSTQ